MPWIITEVEPCEVWGRDGEGQRSGLDGAVEPLPQTQLDRCPFLDDVLASIISALDGRTSFCASLDSTSASRNLT